MTREMLLKLRESALSVLPVSAVVLALHFTLTPMPVWTLFMFLAGVALLILGMGLFTMGADLAMMPIGDAIGADLTRSRKLWLIVGSAFVLGVAVTVAEPDLQLLTKQVPAVPDAALVAAVALGVGVFFDACADPHSVSDPPGLGADRVVYAGVPGRMDGRAGLPGGGV